jgi:Uma2 family endonuclease
MAAREPMRMTYAAYLELEARSGHKHEWLDGIAYAMAGGTPEHAGLALAVGAELRAALRDKPCRVYSSDLKVRVLATYPDATVVCGKLETHPEDANAATNPTLEVEVLSDGTEAYDRGQKFGHYRRIPSLREVVLVSQRERRIEVYRRGARGWFELFEAGPGEAVELETTGAPLSVDAIYQDPVAG